ncbi:Cyclin B and related kinase-activating proteins [Ceraceosorus bombacis]|uniref:Cyclin B and related kinase-activating proteins n=1 Tax=Ceraceosorus bombacis TaxID=401625 RepID=A0A0N7L983_9BASI|nr:Cyclin B and related kinase-activating proteins [Ceraceosorus bombacis]
MPAAPSTSSMVSRRSSFYDRHRRTDSSGSSSSSSLDSGLASSATSMTSSSSAAKGQAAKAKSSASSHRASPRTQAHQYNAVASAASTAAKRAASSASKASTSAAKLGAEAFKAEARPIVNDMEYYDEALKHMHHMELATLPNVDLMDAQPELRWYMRPYLVDFIIEIHQTFRLRAETLYLTMNIVDRYVSTRIVYKRHYQLVGCAALLIASKFEDAKDRVPRVEELSQMCGSAYDESAFTQMEGHVLQAIGWTLGFPSPEAWLRASCLTTREDPTVQSVARFFMELSLYPREFLGVLPSLLSGGAVMLARYICGQEPRALQDAEEAAAAAQLLDCYLRANYSALSQILVRKHGHAHNFGASAVVIKYYTNIVKQERLLSDGLASEVVTSSTKASPCNLSSGGVRNLGTPRRETSAGMSSAMVEDEDDDVSMRSCSASPSCMSHTPIPGAQERLSAPSKEHSTQDAQGKENNHKAFQHHSHAIPPPAQPVFVHSSAAPSRPALVQQDVNVCGA